MAKYLKAPLQVVIGVGDLCVQSLTGNVAYGNSMGCPTPHTPSPPTRSCAANSPSNNSPAENRKMVKPSTDNLRRSRNAQPLGGRGKVAPAGVGRIDRIDEEEEETSDSDEQ